MYNYINISGIKGETRESGHKMYATPYDNQNNLVRPSQRVQLPHPPRHPVSPLV